MMAFWCRIWRAPKTDILGWASLASFPFPAGASSVLRYSCSRGSYLPPSLLLAVSAVPFVLFPSDSSINFPSSPIAVPPPSPFSSRTMKKGASTTWNDPSPRRRERGARLSRVLQSSLPHSPLRKNRGSGSVRISRFHLDRRPTKSFLT